MARSLSNKQVRRLVIASQALHQKTVFGLGVAGVAAAVQRLSYVQIDTISVVQRAHHHTLWNRLSRYSTELLDQAVADKALFEYWSHAAAYLPMSDYRFSLPRKAAIARGELQWFKKDTKQAQYVLDRIRAEGPLLASDFNQKRSIIGSGWGDMKPAKRALEQLFMEGELMICRRQGFQKVFDLSERVVPQEVGSSMPSEQELIDYLIFRFLAANGLATPAEISYLRKGLKPLVQARCNELYENGDIDSVLVEGKAYFVRSDFDQVLAHRQRIASIKILSPFDNLVIQRARMKTLFDFDYQIECYIPAAKRVYGYFALPLLAGQNFIGRMDAKVDRKSKRLVILNLALEGISWPDQIKAMAQAINEFMCFNDAKTVLLEHLSINGKPHSSKRVSELSKLILD